MTDERRAPLNLELVPSRLPRLIGFHAVRWACLLGLAILTYLLFPVAGSVDIPMLEPGEISPAEVIAPFDFVVEKTPGEIEREAAALAATIPPIFDFKSAVVDSVRAQADTLFAALTAAPGLDSLTAALANTGLRLTSVEIEYLSAAGRLAAFRNATTSLLERSLAEGVMSPGAERPIARDVIVRRNGSEQLARRGTLLTYQLFLDMRYVTHPAPNSTDGDQVFLKFISHLFRPTLVYNAADTEQHRQDIRASVNPIRDSVRVNMRIVDANDPVTNESNRRLIALRAELLRRGGGGGGSLSGIVGQVMANGVVLAVFWLLVMIYRRDIYDTMRHLGVMTLLFAIVLIGAWVNRIQFGAVPQLIPIPFAAMLITVLFRGRVAMVAALVLAILVASQAACGGGDAIFIATVGGVAASVSVRGMRRRAQFLGSVLIVIAAFVVAEVAVGLRSGWNWSDVGMASLSGTSNAVVSAAVAFVLLTVFEAATKVTTDLTLLELADPNRPLVRRLATEAPGTYAHSIAMANLCESACNAIGANGLLARVGCYYHDVGKLKRPSYFVENQVHGVNPHDKLKPDASAAIIRNHVKEGLELADEHKLPEVVKAFIPEHHGTMELAYFLGRARERQSGGEVRVENYRYPGPKPSSVETTVVMLADGVEASLRVIADLTPEKLRSMIDHLIQQRIEAGQLEESPVTIAQLARIREEFMRVLAGAYHARIDYPAAGGGITADYEPAPSSAS